ncbi:MULTISPECIES: TCR/Tet family MFS transporter [Pseudoxanthomonas]|uniref:DHA1 family tetracycline resistance protein-like MFS transporter n=1 Tax=Pseudoxanthomonas winnipegensis TaxID=2480810 RepID=A0AAW8GA90_9GAMM|nr:MULTISPECIES: TCR/Tet family MFS transporter [Pseudoxanthomonas]MDQ1119331.1 DHA1 family tetracycline resistance protein-like MFS transporter [Pseudoxanthomonas winnipegensis]MDQ1132527.1 DHA1 family tetracycline resistance protein-like MFS transporter [Pseudoxanthomonas winnipegensis]MDR6137465.1 DHA1 family tetracycline resistance protein-like MFS transporter [Pseudoxanthomonas sp. SORGH_AS_0997]
MPLPAFRAGKAAVAFILVTAMLDIVAMGIIIPVLPHLIEQFSGSNARAGLINGVFVALWALMQFLVSPIVGSLSDRYGRRPVILLSTAGLAIDYLLMALAPNLWWLAAGRIVSGITTASFTTVYAYMADITTPENRARGYGLIGAAFSAGFVAGPLLGGVLGEWSPRAPFWAAAAMSTLAFTYGAFVLPESLAPDKRMAFSWSRANPLGALRLLRSHQELTGLAVVNFLLYFAHHVFSAVFVLYAADRYGWGAWQVGLLLAMVGALDMLVQGTLTGPAVRRFGDRRTMIIGLCFGALGIACMGLAPTGWLFVAAMLPNALWGLAMPTIQSLMTQRVSESEQGQLQGANNSVGAIAGVVSPVFFGWVYSKSVGAGAALPFIGTPFLIAAGVLAAAALTGIAVARRQRAPAG